MHIRPGVGFGFGLGLCGLTVPPRHEILLRDNSGITTRYNDDTAGTAWCVVSLVDVGDHGGCESGFEIPNQY